MGGIICALKSKVSSEWQIVGQQVDKLYALFLKNPQNKCVAIVHFLVICVYRF